MMALTLTAWVVMIAPVEEEEACRLCYHQRPIRHRHPLVKVLILVVKMVVVVAAAAAVVVEAEIETELKLQRKPNGTMKEIVGESVAVAGAVLMTMAAVHLPAARALVGASMPGKPSSTRLCRMMTSRYKMGTCLPLIVLEIAAQ
jgi:hypothetical protein